MRNDKSTIKIILIAIIIMILVLAAIFGIKWIKNTFFAPEPEPIELPEEEVVYGDEYLGIDPDVDKQLEGYRNVLIMGIDTETREYSSGNRSDAIVIVSIDEENKDVKMFSVYRDTYLKINDEYGLDKVNHAYAFGGFNLSTYAINTNLDLNIRESIALTWDVVRTMVDELDGITINIQSSEIATLNGMLPDEYHITAPGEQTINGEQAVQYCRMRYDSSDFRRNERFKVVLAQAFTEAKALDHNDRVQLADKMMDMIVTNTSNMNAIETMLDLTDYEIKNSTEWPYYKRGAMIDSIYYAVPIDLQKNVSELHYNLFGQEEYIPTNKVIDISNAIRERTGI